MNTMSSRVKAVAISLCEACGLDPHEVGANGEPQWLRHADRARDAIEAAWNAERAAKVLARWAGKTATSADHCRANVDVMIDGKIERSARNSYESNESAVWFDLSEVERESLKAAVGRQMGYSLNAGCAA